MLKSYGWCGGGGGGGWWRWVVAHKILVPAQGPLVLGFWVFGFLGLGANGLGPGLDNNSKVYLLLIMC